MSDIERLKGIAKGNLVHRSEGGIEVRQGDNATYLAKILLDVLSRLDALEQRNKP